MNGTFDETTRTMEQADTKQTAAVKKTKTVKKSVYFKLFAVQQNLKAHKGQYNDFGDYNYRSAEDILEAVKPLAAEQEAIILINDEIFNLNNQTIREQKGDSVKEMPCNYIKATVKFVDCETGDTIEASAYARECVHTGMSADQCTGCASSYARKYALNALLCIDNTADSDSNAVAEIENKARQQRNAQSQQNNVVTPNNGWGRKQQTNQQPQGQPQRTWGQNASGWSR